jgi:indole-3-glycerol phosphate synthase
MDATTQTYLDRIVPAVRRRLEERKRALPLRTLEQTALPSQAPSFVEAIAAPGMSLIAEVKRASPSKGPIRPDLDVATLVQTYERAGARAVSVLTEEDFFRGSFADLRAAVAATRLPVLRKDFIVDEYQIHEARAAGAAAVLLIAALLSDREIAALAGVAAELGVAVLLEVHDTEEAERALRVDGVVIGVNNRDLRTFEVSVQTTVDVSRHIPRDRLLVGESGIVTFADVEMLQRAGVDGVLVGESLLRSSDVDAAVSGLLGGRTSGPDGSHKTLKGEAL